MTLRFHGNWRSSCAYRVRIAFAFKGIPYELVPVNIQSGAQHAETFTAINPSAQVPVLEVDEGGRVVHIGQSLAILEYLEERFPTPPLLPRDPIARARSRQLAEIINSGTQPLQCGSVVKALEARGVNGPEWCQLHILRGLKSFERVAQETSGRFSVGDEPTFADCTLVPQLFNARAYGVDVDRELPLLARLEAHCLELDAFAAAHPHKQPDAPPQP